MPDEIIFSNGKFIMPDQAKIPVLSPALLYGWGIFETMRSYKNRIVYFDRHLQRMKESARPLGLISLYSPGEIKHLVRETVKRCRADDVRVRVILWAYEGKSEMMIRAKKYSPPGREKYSKGFSACVSSLRQAENSSLARIKLTIRVLYELSFRQAKENGCDEALILNNRGYICEASRSNIFFIKGKDLFTPSPECPCLPGISRRVIFDIAAKHNIPLYEGKFTLNDLASADAAFLANSLIGVMPLANIEGKPIGNCCHSLTGFFMRSYSRLLVSGSIL